MKTFKPTIRKLLRGRFLFRAYVICRNCNYKIPVERPPGKTKISGPVRVKPGVEVEGGKITIRPGEGISLGPGGKLELGAPPKGIAVLCPRCSYYGDYKVSEIIEE